MPQGGVVNANYNVPTVRERIREGLSSDELQVIAHGTPVKNQEGVIGKVDHVFVDTDSNEITHLVVRHGIVFPEQLDIPVSLIERVSEKGVLITATNEELESLTI